MVPWKREGSVTVTLALTLAVLLLSAGYLIWQWYTGDLEEEDEELDEELKELFDRDAYDADYASVLEGLEEEEDDEV